MSFAKEVARHVPHLRRFARAMSGAQQSGDAYVAATLEAFLADGLTFPAADGARVGLYRMFLKLWTSVALNTAAPLSDSASAAQRNLNQLTPASRQAFLLRTVEDFPEGDIASILGTSLDEVGALIDTAGREIAAQIATDVLIIEDEPLIALDIEALLMDLGHRVTGIARTRAEAAALAAAKRPGLVLADIQLADGSSGLDAVNDILAGFDVPVIFITAYPERLLTGLRPEPAFLLTKPFHAGSVKATVSQALFFDRKASRGA